MIPRQASGGARIRRGAVPSDSNRPPNAPSSARRCGVRTPICLHFERILLIGNLLRERAYILPSALGSLGPNASLPCACPSARLPPCPSARLPARRSHDDASRLCDATRERLGRALGIAPLQLDADRRDVWRSRRPLRFRARARQARGRAEHVARALQRPHWRRCAARLGSDACRHRTLDGGREFDFSRRRKHPRAQGGQRAGQPRPLLGRRRHGAQADRPHRQPRQD